MNSPGPLPFMKTFGDALALCAQERDPFYPTAFMIEAWLGQVVLEAAAEYAETKLAKDRTLQTGQASRIFHEFFGHSPDSELPHILSSLIRFAEHDDVQAHLLRRALVPVSCEHECHGDYLGPRTMAVLSRPTEATKLVRRSVARWCDWVDALVHFQMHADWHLQPAKFDPDPEKRELAVLGIKQRHFARLGDFSKAWWQWHHGEAAERFRQSPKWSTLGKAMAADEVRLWRQPGLDSVLISLWPLLKRNNWTYRDLQAVARMILPAPHRYPLESEPELATYCQNVLGLRKGRTSGRSHPKGKPAGWEVALTIFPTRTDAS